MFNMNDINKIMNSTDKFVAAIQKSTNKIVNDAINQQNRNVNGGQNYGNVNQQPFNQGNGYDQYNPYMQPQQMNVIPNMYDQPVTRYEQQNYYNQNVHRNVGNQVYQQPQNYQQPNYGQVNYNYQKTNPNIYQQPIQGNNQHNPNQFQNIGNSYLNNNNTQNQPRVNTVSHNGEQQKQNQVQKNFIPSDPFNSSLYRYDSQYLSNYPDIDTLSSHNEDQEGQGMNSSMGISENRSKMSGSKPKLLNSEYLNQNNIINNQQPQNNNSISNQQQDKDQISFNAFNLLSQNIQPGKINLDGLNHLNQLHNASSESLFKIDKSKISSKKSYMNDLESIPFVASIKNESFEDSRIEIIKSKIYSGYSFKGCHARAILQCLESTDSQVEVALMLFDYIYDGQCWQTICPIEYNDDKLSLANKLLTKASTNQSFSLVATIYEVLEIRTLIEYLKMEKSWPEVQLKMLELALKCGNRTDGELAKQILQTFMYCDDQVIAAKFLKEFLVDKNVEKMLEGIEYEDTRSKLRRELI